MLKHAIFCRTRKVLSFSLAILTTVVLATGCSKKDDGGSTPDEDNSNKGKNYKITITVSSAVETSDYLSLITVGGAEDSNESTLWKLNGETQDNQQSVSLGRNEFTGDTKTYTIESLKPLKICLVGIQFINFDQDLKFSLKIESEGKSIIEEKDKTLSGESSDFTKDYKF